jgi:hypothetical protein
MRTNAISALVVPALLGSLSVGWLNEQHLRTLSVGPRGGGPPSEDQQMPAGATEQTILSLERRWLDAWVRRDLAPIDDLWADDALGVAEQRYAKSALKKSTTLAQVGKYSIGDVKSIDLGGEAVVLSYRLDFLPKRGHSYASSVWLRRDRRWRLVLHQDSIPSALPLSQQSYRRQIVRKAVNTGLADLLTTVAVPEDDPVQREMLMFEALKNRDADTINHFWADDVLLVDTQRVSKQSYLRMVPHSRVKDYLMTEVKPISLGRNAVVVSYKILLRSVFSEHDVLSQSFYISSVWARRGEDWQVVFQHDTQIK